MIRRHFLLGSVAAFEGGREVVVIVLGPPGSGKTTQAEFLKKKYGIPIFSAATLLKKSHDRKSDFTKKTKDKISPDEMLTDAGMNDLVREAVIKADHQRGFILDGYPMTKGQAEFLRGLLNEIALPTPLIVHLDASDALVKQRMEQRGRADDKPAIIERRIAAYRHEEQTVLDFYGPNQVLRADGTKSAAEISKQIESALAAKGK